MISFDEETYGVEIHSENGKYKLAERTQRIPALPVLRTHGCSFGFFDSRDPHTLAVSNDELRP